MAHLWLPSGEKWLPTSLIRDVLVLHSNPLQLAEPNGSGEGIFLMRSIPSDSGAGREIWVLIPSPHTRVRVNGAATAAMHVLTDRDEIRIGYETIFFSTERLVQLVPFPEPAPVLCARCNLPIAPGSPAVCCPNSNCAVWHHQSGDYPCWTYHTACAMCGRETDLASSYQWTPEEC